MHLPLWGPQCHQSKKFWTKRMTRRGVKKGTKDQGGRLKREAKEHTKQRKKGEKSQVGGCRHQSGYHHQHRPRQSPALALRNSGSSPFAVVAYSFPHFPSHIAPTSQSPLLCFWMFGNGFRFKEMLPSPLPFCLVQWIVWDYPPSPLLPLVSRFFPLLPRPSLSPSPTYPSPSSSTSPSLAFPCYLISVHHRIPST
eukprot:NODE_4963_length_737_cov_15.469477_g4607_i0.p2 GENE.NODE_4963_length_737_cov_15.469477_g4607_i0~~NODE_4963_length_737_cov_15.469477_g4607_i0.p2  ORF type:complete len:196 (+),score=11.24 NODE_4963_length_737_cov_15.469477_g4607_i0:101-688(+)